jgi:cysteine-rich repeat protein
VTKITPNHLIQQSNRLDRRAGLLALATRSEQLRLVWLGGMVFVHMACTQGTITGNPSPPDSCPLGSDCKPTVYPPDNTGTGIDVGNLLPQPLCGNGIREFQAGERCDDGVNDGSYGTCAPDCTFASYCGDGVTNPEEECDDAEGNSDRVQGACSRNCRYSICGDGLVQGKEQCDDGNGQDNDGCSSRCMNEQTTCNGTGTPDCAGTCNGAAIIDCAGTCNGAAVIDCAGTCNGSATIDCAGSCNGTAVIDCAETCNGAAIIDCAGTCNGPATPDCAGSCNGTAVEDQCGFCDRDSTNDCIQDCEGTWGGGVVEDGCGICGGPNLDTDNDGTLDCVDECLDNSDKVLAGHCGCEVVETSQTLTYTVTESSQPTDILFLVDTSGSMNDDRKNLADNFGSFIDTINQFNTDWRILVVENRVGAIDAAPKEESIGCSPIGYLDPTMPDYVTKFQEAVRDASRGTRSIRRASNEGEKLLYSADRALLATAPDGCNEGFLRPNALLHIIVVSDEKDQSEASWQTYVDRARDVKNNHDLVRYSAVVNPDEVNICMGRFSSESAGVGYVEAVNATGGTVIDICDPAWADHMTVLGQTSVNQNVVLEQGDPVQVTIEVWLNGNLVPAEDWTYDSATQMVILHGLNANDAIEIHYIGCHP